MTFAPSRAFPASLKDGWKKFTNNRNDEYSRARGRRRLQPLVTPVPHGAPDHGAVLLFNPGLVVLAIRTAAREHQPRFFAVGFHGLVHEYDVVVRVEPEQYKWHAFPNLGQDFG